MQNLQVLQNERRRRARPEPELKPVISCRDEVLIDELSSALPESDAALLRAVFRQRQSSHELSLILNQSARVVRTRVRRLVLRVLSREFMFVLRRSAEWSTRRRGVAMQVYVMGRTLRRTAVELGVSLYAARKELDAVRTLMDGGGR